MTHQWWNNERTKYQFAVSQFVIDEASAGDPTLAEERLESLEGIPLLPLVDEIADISDEIMARIHAVLNDLGIPIPIICTPDEMLDNDPETSS